MLHPISRKLSPPQGEKKSPCSSGQSRGCGQGGLKPPGGRGVRRAGLCPSSASVPLPASPKARARQARLKVYGQHNSTELIMGKKKKRLVEIGFCTQPPWKPNDLHVNATAVHSKISRTENTSHKCARLPHHAAEPPA